MGTKQKHPMDAARLAAMNTIGKIADRAVAVYAKYDTRLERSDVLMDLMACHFHGQKLRLDDLLAADDTNFIHDISGINIHLDRETYALTDGFSPRFAMHAERAA
jgi:hypothetical protein